VWCLYSIHPDDASVLAPLGWRLAPFHPFWPCPGWPLRVPSPRTNKFSHLGVCCVYQVLLCSNKDRVIQCDISFLCSPLNDGLSLSIIGDRIDICYLVYRLGYLLIAPCEYVSQATGGVYLFKIGLLNFLVVPRRPDLYLSLIRGLSIERNSDVGHRLVTYFLVGRRTVDFLLRGFFLWLIQFGLVLQICSGLRCVGFLCFEATFNFCFLLWVFQSLYLRL
jgi:hypothetical protein